MRKNEPKSLLFLLLCSLLILPFLSFSSLSRPDSDHAVDVNGIPEVNDEEFDFIPENDEKAFAQRIASEMETEAEVMEDGFLNGYLDGIGRRIVLQNNIRDLIGDWDWSFQIIDSSDINAFATLGGRVYIFRGLLEATESESELAAILAFELGHFISRHVHQHIYRELVQLTDFSPEERLKGEEGWRKLSRIFQAAGGVLTFFSRQRHDSSQVEKVDELTLLNIHNAQFDPKDFLIFLRRLGKRDDPFPLWLRMNPWDQKRRRKISASLRMFPSQPSIEDFSEFNRFKTQLKSVSSTFPQEEERPLVSREEVVRQLTVSGKMSWTDTGIDVIEGQEIYFNANGTVFLQQGNLVAHCGPDGYNLKSRQQPLTNHNLGALIGKVAVLFSIEINKDNGREFRYEVVELFYIGSESEVIMPMNGRLYLGINEDLVGDNSGEYTVNLIYRSLILP